VAETDHRETPPRTPARPAHILLAEDNLVNQKVIAHLLSHLGHSVDIVSNGREAVAAAGRGCYDAILMDCHMPEMSGYEATRLMRQQDHPGRRPPIIALTASALAGDRARCLESGMDDYISKPVNLETLSRVLDEWLADPVETPEHR
jgi:CheY-like chemotaxis protein